MGMYQLCEPLTAGRGASADHSTLLRYALDYAVMAPSTHNSQPWRFRVAPDRVDLCADRARSLPIADPHDRELTISCGASLFFLRTAIRHLGWDEATVLLPDPTDGDLLARVALEGQAPPALEDERLFAAIPVRRTVRTPFRDQEVEACLLADLQTAAAREGAVFHPIEGAGRRGAVAILVDDADRMQASDLAFRRELAQWVHPNRSVRRDGLPASVFGFGDTLSYAGPAAVRWLDWGRCGAGTTSA
jgi:nitroreductase